MFKRRLIVLAAALLLAVALAQDGSPGSVETRLSIVESRLGRLEADVSRLSEVPVSLARIEQKLTALTEKSDGQGAILSTVALGIVMSVITGAIGFTQGRRQKQ